MFTYDVVMQQPEYTVMAEYVAPYRGAASYQSEAQLENEFIAQLVEQGYERLQIRQEADLIANLREKLEQLNGLLFSDGEWERLFRQQLANSNEGIVEKTRRLQVESRIAFVRDDGSTRNITLLDKEKPQRNILQVINQYETDKGRHRNRYDVTILVNGFPMVHVELKRRGVLLRQAFNQINRYQQDSFWAGSGLYEYVQIFVISNGTFTRYYSNTTRDAHVREQDGRSRSGKKTSNSYQFTCNWADAANKPINDLEDFARTFLARHTLLTVLARYCVFTAENLLLVMRPYQIAATERILERIAIANTYKKSGTLEGGGYIWHTTGSGKTLTSFKTAQLASALGYVDKVLFVVDRKDLDYQTIKEYDRFQKGAANSNTSVNVLTRQLSDPKARIIITTIQKLAIFIKRNPDHPVYTQRIVLIFDECHRSQFGELHTAIVRKFKNYNMFGFTGTPIFAINSGSGGNPLLKTTEQAFGEKLHTYTIVDAIRDNTVLPFNVSYLKTIRMGDNVKDKKVLAINEEKAMTSAERVSAVVAYVLENFDTRTVRNASYSLKGQRRYGFNAIMAVESIPMAMKYYTEFARQQASRPQKLTIATIFSYQANPDDPDESFNTTGLDRTSRDFLDDVIRDYNRNFNTNFSTDGDSFENWYKDISRRMKEREIDLLIVVNMFLTGFDATTLNTLWVDKNLRMHGLIQAYSRTNRILNSVKTFGNIVCFRDLQKATDDAIALFGNKDAHGIVLLKSFDEYYNGLDEEGPDGSTVHKPGYVDLIRELQEKFPLGEEIPGTEAEKEFINLMGAVLRLQNILRAFDEYRGKEILTERDQQNYVGVYLHLHDKLRPAGTEKEDILDDIVFEMELVKQIQIDCDYIIRKVKEYKNSNCQDRTILADIRSAMDASPELRSKRELIEGFILRVNPDTDVDSEFKDYVLEQRKADMQVLIEENKLKPEAARAFLENALRDGELRTIGVDIQNIMPPSNPFDRNSAEKKKGILARILAFFEKYVGLFAGEWN